MNETECYKSLKVHARHTRVTFSFTFKKPTSVAMKRSALAEPPERQSNIPVLTDRWEPPPDLPHSHLNNERRAGVMSNLGARYRRWGGQASIARHESRAPLACGKSPRVLRISAERCMAGIKSLGLTELSCLRGVNMPKVLSVTVYNFTLRGK